MPIKACTLPGGGSGFQWGDHGTCYPTREQAEKQAAAAHANGFVGDVAFDATARTYDKDGRLHISRSHISKACVNPYYGREIPGSAGLGLDPDAIYYLLRDPKELAKAAPTFARLPILKKHVPVTADAPRQDLIVGAIGSEVEFLDPYLDADVSIWDAEAIAGIETDKIREFSCAYHYVPIMSPGNYYGEPFDGIMTQIQGNHLALVESGRAGSDVLAADSKLGEPMKRTKFGKAVATTLTVAFPKVKIAQDSELDKLIAGATPKTLDKAAIKTLVLAMDAEIPAEKVSVVMDALTDVDEPEAKPAKDKKGAKDADPDDETEEERKKREKKEAEDAEERDKDTKAAMDSLRKELREADEARRDVRPVVGEVIAQDSAADIYGFALDHLKVDHKDVEGVPALRALFKVASAKSATVTPVHVAMDSDAAEKQFPGLARIRRA